MIWVGVGLDSQDGRRFLGRAVHYPQISGEGAGCRIILIQNIFICRNTNDHVEGCRVKKIHIFPLGVCSHIPYALNLLGTDPCLWSEDYCAIFFHIFIVHAILPLATPFLNILGKNASARWSLNFEATLIGLSISYQFYSVPTPFMLPTSWITKKKNLKLS